MRYVEKSFRISCFEFAVEFDSGGDVGGEITVYITDVLGQPLIARTFFFGGNNQHIRAFAKKFANDLEYRQACLDDTIEWARLANWYRRNSRVYTPLLMTLRSASTTEERRELARTTEYTGREMERLYKSLRQHLDELESLQAFKDHVAAERDAEVAQDVVDAGVLQAVLLLNAIPGVSTQFSCQGVRNCVDVDWWDHGPIWFPGEHGPLAHMQFAQIPPELASELDAFLYERGVGECRPRRASANRPEHNAAFVQALEDFAQDRVEDGASVDLVSSCRPTTPRPWESDPDYVYRAQCAAVWHFRKGADKAQTLWEPLAYDEKLSITCAFLDWANSVKQQSPKASVDLLLQVHAIGLRAEWRRAPRPGSRQKKKKFSYLVIESEPGFVKWRLAPHRSKRTGKVSGMALYRHEGVYDPQDLDSPCRYARKPPKADDLVEYILACESIGTSKE